MKNRRRRPHAQIHLPVLSADEALLLATIFDRASDAIWRAHGDAMADFQDRSFPDAPPPQDAVPTVDHDPDNDSDLF